MSDHRQRLDGNPIDFTCINSRYRTNTAIGEPHGDASAARGSVFREPLIEDGEYSLWLEHVVANREPDDRCYWLMWYRSGRPTIPLSGVFSREHLANMQSLLASLVP